MPPIRRRSQLAGKVANPPPHPDRRAHESPAQERRQRRGHEVTAQLQGQDQAEDRTVQGDERDGQRWGHEEGQEGQRHQPEAKPRQPEHAARQCQDAGSRQPRQAHATPFHHARGGPGVGVTRAPGLGLNIEKLSYAATC